MTGRRADSSDCPSVGSLNGEQQGGFLQGRARARGHGTGVLPPGRGPPGKVVTAVGVKNRRERCEIPTGAPHFTA